jgi:hypothetical protein
MPSALPPEPWPKPTFALLLQQIIVLFQDAS